MNAALPFDIEVEPRPRAPRAGSLPTVSVVVASCRTRALLHSCLGSLVPQCASLGAEIIVARPCEADEAAALEHAYPTIRLVRVPANATVPQLRAAGMARAVGDVVALTEDHCVADPHWLQTLLRGATTGADIVGGGMDNAQRSRAVDWAAYFAEYGLFATGRPESEASPPAITGANVAYHRRVVGEVIEWARRGEWENVAHTRLFAHGSGIRFVGTAAVSQNGSYRFSDFCADRYQHGHDYARKRLVEEPGANRWVHVALTPALPFVLTGRIARAAARTRFLHFLHALPVTFAFLAAWSVGEAVGYLRGPATEEPQ